MAKPIRSVSVVGLGRLGSPIATCLAARGFDVVGVDNSEQKVDALNRAQPPVYEPGLAELLPKAAERLRGTTDMAEAICATDATLIIVPTPSEADGTFSLRYALPACEQIGQALRTKRGYHLVVMTSTVMPGHTGGPIQQALERASGKKCGRDFGLCYSPEFVALGSVIRDFLCPDFLLIGQFDQRSGDGLESIYQQACESAPPAARLSFVNAELAKISVNAYITTKITFANMIAGICHQVPGADVDAVTDALGLDSRIGPKYLKGAVAYGGPCFPRDNVALAAFARSVEAGAGLSESVHACNHAEVDRLVSVVGEHCRPGQTVAVLGLAYKPGSDVVEQSPGVKLAAALAKRGLDVVAYDPAAMENARAACDQPVRYAESMRACLAEAHVAVLVTPWDEMKQLDAAALAGTPVQAVIDCWRVLDGGKLGRKVKLVPLGVGATCVESLPVEASGDRSAAA